MGITNYHTWLEETYPQAHIQIQNNNIYDYIYIDSNHILHHSIYNITTLEEFFDKIRHFFDVIFSNFIAKKAVYINIDGPSTYAKILLQRERRGNMDCSKELSPLVLTPGTKVMEQIESVIHGYVEDLKQYYMQFKPEFYISGNDEYGEGEIKVCKQIIANKIGTHLVIGNDSDLVVLSMAIKPIVDINILFKAKYANKLVSIKKLIELHAEKIGLTQNLANSCMRDDFVIVSLLMGNDYFPKISCIKNTKIWDVYFKFIKKEKCFMMKDGCRYGKRFEMFMVELFNSLSIKYKKEIVYDFGGTRLYLEGLLWCLNMYQTGECSKYDYVYDKKSQHPFMIAILANEHYVVPKSLVHPINSKLYPVFVLPSGAKEFVIEKYKYLLTDDMVKLNERCEICDGLRARLSELHKAIKIMKTFGDNPVSQSKEYGEVMKNLMCHKKKHLNNEGELINKIIEIVNKIA